MARKQINTWYTPPKLSDDTGAETPVAIVAPNYGLEHVTYLLDVPGYRHRVLRRLPLHRLERRGTFLNTTPVLFPSRAALVHTFNMLPLNGPPFVATFESELPFLLGPMRHWQHRVAHRIMAHQRCRALLSFSDTAADLAREKYAALGLPDIVSKIATFRGGVQTSTHAALQRFSGPEAPLRLIFVGGDGLRKGIEPVLSALQTLIDTGIKVELTVISSLPETTYALRGVTCPHAEILKTLRTAPWITYHASMPYAQVRAEMAQHDLLLLPTLDETLGWVVIEAAMEGKASITSNAFALPELVKDHVTGRIIDLPLGAGKRWIGIHSADRTAAWHAAKDILHRGLIDAITQADRDRSLAPKWGVAARSFLEPLYRPDQAGSQLAAIYDTARGG